MRRYERSWWWVKEKKQLALVFRAIIIVMLQLQMKGCLGCVESERMGLLQLKSYFNSLLRPGEESILKSWTHVDRGSDCCHWKGVKCSEDIGGHIVHLSLNGLKWSTYAQPFNLSLLHSFPQLQTFNCSGYLINHFFDPIYGYKSFQRLKKLRTLNFYRNELNNSILPFLSAAKSLTTLDLSYNSLNGVFPPNELANMTELRVMNLGMNGFSSFSVQGLINLSNLEVLDLSSNGITDIMAGDGLNTTKLKTLDLSYNYLAATTRLDALKYMSKLQELDLKENEFIDLDSLGEVVIESKTGLL